MTLLQATGQRWSLDLLSNALMCGSRFRIPAVIDDCSRECLSLVADRSLSGRRVAQELTVLIMRNDKPLMIVAGSGTEFALYAIRDWAETKGIEQHYIAPEKSRRKPFHLLGAGQLAAIVIL